MPECGRCGKPANGGKFPLCDECAWGAIRKLTEGKEEVVIEGHFTRCECVMCRRQRAARNN